MADGITTCNGRPGRTALVIPTRLGARPAVECRFVMRRRTRLPRTAHASFHSHPHHDLRRVLPCAGHPPLQSVRSLWRTDIVSRYTSRSTAGVQRYYRLHAVSEEGRLSFEVDHEVTPSFITKPALEMGRPWELWLNRPTYRGPLTVRDPAFLGFTYLGPDKFSRPGDGSYTFRVGVPWWALTLMISVFPIVALSRRWQQRRADRRGLCRTCGYDLRETPDRCPECGAMPTSRATEKGREY